MLSGGSATIGSVIAGTLGLTQAGETGTLILTGTDTYTGGTTISAGTLQIGAGGTTGSVTGNIVDNAALVFNRSNALTYGGIISGTGSVTQTGTGTLTLSGTNTYTGATTINGGTLALAGPAASRHRARSMWQCRRHVQHCGHHGGRHHHDAQGRRQQQGDAGRPDADDRERLDHLRGHHRRHRRADPDGGHRDPSGANT